MKTAKEKVIKKMDIEDIPKEKKSTVKLVSYSMKMVIPTGNYANIQPEIIVKAGSVEEAHNYIAPHFNKLWKEYYLVEERRPDPIVPVNKVAPEAPMSSVAFIKANQAINSCTSLEAMEIIKNQVAISTKLTNEDKEKLQPIIEERSKIWKTN